LRFGSTRMAIERHFSLCFESSLFSFDILLKMDAFEHRKLTYRYQGRDFCLTDIHGHLMHDILA